MVIFVVLVNHGSRTDMIFSDSRLIEGTAAASCHEGVVNMNGPAASGSAVGIFTTTHRKGSGQNPTNNEDRGTCHISFHARSSES